MENYVRNRGCRCIRCMAWDLMGAAVLITLGVLLLLQHLVHVSFWIHTWPVLLIVIGVVLFLRSAGSTAGHIIPPDAPAAGTPAAPSAPETKDPSHG